MTNNNSERLRDTLRMGDTSAADQAASRRKAAPQAEIKPESKLVVGCGYLGRRVADLWRAGARSFRGHALARSCCQEFAHAGLRPIVADVMRLETLVGLPTAQTVLYAVGYDRQQSFGIQEVYLRGLVNVLNALPTATGRLIYVSSTGVYGDCGGEWIDEHAVLTRNAPGAKPAWPPKKRSWPIRTVRTPSFCGWPGSMGRDAFRVASRSKKSRPSRPPPAGWLNLIHVDDAASGRARRRAGRAGRGITWCRTAVLLLAAITIANWPNCSKRLRPASWPRMRRSLRRYGRPPISGSAMPGCAKSWASAWPFRRIARDSPGFFRTVDAALAACCDLISSGLPGIAEIRGPIV